MTLFFVFLGIALILGALASAVFAFLSLKPWAKPAGTCACIAMLVAAVLVAVYGITPGLIEERIRQSTELATRQFRETMGQDPDRLEIIPIDRGTGGWRYDGTAHIGDKTWDVSVWSVSVSKRKDVLKCAIRPRK